MQAHPNLSLEQRTKAEATIGLTGLDREPAGDEPKASDRRLENRRMAWKKAKRSLQRLQAADSQSMREQIVDTVNGFWSVWMTVFCDYPEHSFSRLPYYSTTISSLSFLLRSILSPNPPKENYA